MINNELLIHFVLFGEILLQNLTFESIPCHSSFKRNTGFWCLEHATSMSIPFKDQPK